MQVQIENTLIKFLNPKIIEVVNESYKHNVPQGAESHFKITAISEEFKNLTKIARHKMIFKILESEIKSIHAISLALFTPEEWEKNPNKTHITPNCAKVERQK